jgi:hypothetical protein
MAFAEGVKDRDVGSGVGQVFPMQIGSVAFSAGQAIYRAILNKLEIR